MNVFCEVCTIFDHTMLFIYYDLKCETVHLVTSIDTWIVGSIPLIEKNARNTYMLH